MQLPSLPITRLPRAAAALTTLAATAWLVPQAPALAAGEPTGTVLEQFYDWTLLADGPGKAVCFIASTPKPEAGAAARDGVVLYVSAWPKEGVKTELSAKLGGKPRKGGDISITVGAASFKLFARDDRAFIDDPTRELKLIEAMKKGAKAVLRAEPEKGSPTVDSFSLSGFGKALQALATQCP